MIDLLKICNVFSKWNRYDRLEGSIKNDYVVLKFINPLHPEIDIIQTPEALDLFDMGLYVCHVNSSKHEIWLREIKLAHKHSDKPSEELKAVTVNFDWSKK